MALKQLAKGRLDGDRAQPRPARPWRRLPGGASMDLDMLIACNRSLDVHDMPLDARSLSRTRVNARKQFGGSEEDLDTILAEASSLDGRETRP